MRNILHPANRSHRAPTSHTSASSGKVMNSAILRRHSHGDHTEYRGCEKCIRHPNSEASPVDTNNQPAKNSEGRVIEWITQYLRDG